ncbi:MAG: glycosyltransferase family 4 protein [Bacteroidota bacterium]
MTVLFQCSGSYVSGMEVVELAVMRGLAARGHRVHALVSGWNNGDFIGRLEAAEIPHTPIHSGKLTVRQPSWMLDTLRHLPGARRTARRLAREVRPDVVVACNRDPVIGLAGVFGRVPLVYHVHTPMPPRWTSRLGRVVDRFLTVSGFIRGQVLAGGIAPDRVDVVYNGVELPESTPAPRRDRTDVPVLGICGQIGAWKGHEDLLDALGHVAGQGVPFELRIYGSGDDAYVAALRERADARGIADRVRWMGFERDQDRMYADLDLLAMPSRFDEPFGLTLAEAGVRGVPAVATHVGGIPEVVADGETGLLVPRHDPEALAQALATVLQDPDRRHALGRAAQERVRASFLTEHMIEGMESALQTAAKT